MTLSLLLLLPLLTGCGQSSLPLVQRAVVKLTAIGADADGFQSKILVLTADKTAEENGEPSKPTVLTGSGQTATDALLDATNQIGKTAFWAQNELILLDKDLTRSQIKTIFEELGTERFNGAKSYIWVTDFDNLEEKADKLYELSQQLEVTSRREGYTLYGYRLSEAYTVPEYEATDIGTSMVACRIWPLKTESFRLWGRQFELYCALTQGEKISCLSGEDSCSVTDITVSVTPYKAQNGEMCARILLNGNVGDYEGQMSREQVAQQVATELEHLFIDFYYDVYLMQNVDVLSISFHMNGFDKAAWTVQSANKTPFSRETLTFRCNVQVTA